jgi:hypothetical protein
MNQSPLDHLEDVTRSLEYRRVTASSMKGLPVVSNASPYKMVTLFS